MDSLFDLGTVAPRPDDDHAEAAHTRAATMKTPVAQKPVEYWVRGIFRYGDGQFTRTVKAVGMRTRLDADAEKFIAYLTSEGWQFPEGRGYLTELLGVGTHDGVRISLSRGDG